MRKRENIRLVLIISLFLALQNGTANLLAKENEGSVLATTGKFELVAEEISQSGKEAGLEIRAKGRLFCTADDLYAETEIKLPLSEAKERYAALILGKKAKYYILYLDTLNFQEIETADETLASILKLLPRFLRMNAQELSRKLMAFGLKLTPIGRKSIEGRTYLAYRVQPSQDGGKKSSMPESSATLYFTQNEQLFRVIEVRAENWFVRLSLSDIKLERTDLAKFRIPEGYYKMEPLYINQRGKGDRSVNSSNGKEK